MKRILLMLSIANFLTAKDEVPDWIRTEYRCEMLNPHEINEIRKNPMSAFLKTAEDFGNAVLYPTCEQRNSEDADCAKSCKEDALARMRAALKNKKDERICGVISPEEIKQITKDCQNSDRNAQASCLQKTVTGSCAVNVHRNNMRGCLKFCIEKSRQIMFGEEEQ